MFPENGPILRLGVQSETASLGQPAQSHSHLTPLSPIMVESWQITACFQPHRAEKKSRSHVRHPLFFLIQTMTLLVRAVTHPLPSHHHNSGNL